MSSGPRQELLCVAATATPSEVTAILGAAAAELEARLTFLKTQNIDLLCTATTPVTRKAKEVFRDTPVPILFAPVFSPVDAGLVDSISQPGGNITGVMARGSTAKALGYLLDILGQSSRALSVPNLFGFLCPKTLNHDWSITQHVI